MAKMYPSEIAPGSPASERRVFNVLKLGLDADWQVLFSTAFFKGNSKTGADEGEVDFILVHPIVGMIGLEVKGGREIRRKKEDGTWWTLPRDSDEWQPIKDPGKQVRNGMHSIVRYVKKKAGNPRLRKLQSHWGVAFPGYRIPNQVDFGLGLPRELIIDEYDFTNPARALKSILKFELGESYQSPRFFDEDITDLLDILMPSLDLVVLPAERKTLTGEIKNRIIEAEQKIIQLTEEQVSAIEIISSQSRVSINGCAGTGKTVVGLELARRFAREGKKVLFLCYNRLLADYYRDNVEGFQVNNFHRFCKEETEKRGGRFPNLSKKDSRKFFDTEVAEMLLLLAEEDPALRWDVIIVDEGQDFKENWWVPINEMLASENSKLWVFFDPNQDLYGGSKLRGLGLTEYSLKNNVRNTKQIAEAAYGCIGVAPQFPRQSPREGVDVQWELLKGVSDKQLQSETVNKVRSILHRLINEEMLDPEEVVVLSWIRKRSSVWKRRRLGNFELIEADQPIKQQQVRFDSIRRFKGLEADAVIVCDVPHVLTKKGRSDLYVGTSRARHVLAVIQNGT